MTYNEDNWCPSRNEQFFSDQGRTRVCGPRMAGQEGVRLYAATGNPRRTLSRTKRAIYGWTLTNCVFDR